jgi:hypothetical protein
MSNLIPKFRAIDASNDWAFGSGVQSYLVGPTAINADIKTALLEFLGECFFALQDGVDWWNLTGGKNPATLAAIILQCRKVILARYGVTAVTSVTATLTGRAPSVAYSASTIYSTNVSGTIQPTP